MTTQPAFCDQIQTLAYLSGSWVDISSYVVDDIEFDWGIFGNSPTDKMASVGGSSFELNNDSGAFTPGSPNFLTGWRRGVKVKHVFTFEGQPYVRFTGKVKRIGLPYRAEDKVLVPVRTVDWLDEAQSTPITGIGVQTNKTVAAGAQTLLASISNQPAATSITVGSDTMSSLFVNMDPRAKMYAELSKLALTEFSFIYLKKDRTYGETLVVESRQSRVSRSLSTISLSKADSPLFKYQDGDHLLLRSGVRLLLSHSQQPIFDNMQGMDIEYGDGLINQVDVRHNPARTDTSLSVLFSLNSPIHVEAGETVSDLKVSYKDPSGGNGRINGYNMVAPVSGTDYQMFVNSNGTGTNLTANLSFSVTYGAAGAVYTSITNTGGTSGYITKLQARGYAVYLDNPVSVFLEDQDSIDDNGLSTISINNQYQTNISVTETIAETTLSQNKDPKVVPTAIRMIANLSADLMLAFLKLDVGDLIRIVQDQHYIDSNMFINSVKGVVHPGGVIEFTWGLVEALFANETYWELETVGRSELEVTTFVSP
jgi:hypothetical protein